jgi:hypothetical protein
MANHIQNKGPHPIFLFTFLDTKNIQRTSICYKQPCYFPRFYFHTINDSNSIVITNNLTHYFNS